MRILIEMDGPLVDVKARYHETHRRVLREINLAALPVDAFWRLVRRNAPLEQLVSGGRSKHVERYKQHFTERIECDEMLAFDAAQEDADGALRSLKVLGEPILITMRLNRPGAQDVLKRLGLADYFLRVGGLSQAQSRRIDQLKELAGEARRVIVVASSEPVIIATREADPPVVGISSGACTPQRLRRAGADVVLDTLDEVSVAIASGSEEMLRAGLLPRGT